MKREVQETTVEDLAKEDAGAFDAVVASEVLEHVGDRRLFLSSAAKLLVGLPTHCRP